MKFDWLRNKTDKEIEEWINNTVGTKTPYCIKCGKVVGYTDRKTINTVKYNPHLGQKSKKLCTLCNDCYTDLLDYLGVCDVEWGEW